MNLSKLSQANRPLSVHWLGEDFRFTYDPRGYGDQVYIEVARLSKLPEENPERLRVNDAMLASMLSAWDLTDGCDEADPAHRSNGNSDFCKEHSLPIVPETLALLPVMLRGKMVTRIMEDMNSDGSAPKSGSS